MEGMGHKGGVEVIECGLCMTKCLPDWFSHSGIPQRGSEGNAAAAYFVNAGESNHPPRNRIKAGPFSLHHSSSYFAKENCGYPLAVVEDYFPKNTPEMEEVDLGYPASGNTLAVLQSSHIALLSLDC